MKTIPLTRGLVALVDDEDYEKLRWFHWWAQKNISKHGYNARRSIKGGYQTMPELILGKRKGFQIDHVNRDTLDNRKSNLRWATATENCRNRKVSNSTGFKGVCKDGKRFRVRIRLSKREIISVNGFMDAESAGRAYDMLALKHFGEFACLNFPREDYASIH